MVYHKMQMVVLLDFTKTYLLIYHFKLLILGYQRHLNPVQWLITLSRAATKGQDFEPTIVFSG